MSDECENLHNERVFVDANAIIYHLHGMCPTAREIFRLGELGEVKLVSTTRVIDEVIHKTLLLRAREKFGIHSKTIKKLRKDKNKVRRLSEDMRRIKRFVDTINLDLKEITVRDLFGIPDIMQEYGVFGNDALILLTMIKYNLQYLLSSDADFKEIKWLTLILANPE